MTDLPPGSRWLHRVTFLQRRSGGSCTGRLTASAWLDGVPMGDPVIDPRGTHDRWQAPSGETYYTPVCDWDDAA